ncbi:MAG: DUF1971 domain-containing protein [Sphingomonadaceae bacterium]
MPSDAILTDPALAQLVDRFYARVRTDPLIGPVFERAVDDWPSHLENLTRFWSSVMFTTGRYKGSPIAAHLKHVDEIAPEMFVRWLQLWRETTSELLSPALAAQFQAKADKIAESLQLAIQFRPGHTPLTSQSSSTSTAASVRPSRSRSYKPYRSTPVFDQNSLPAALQREHRTKAGTWGAIHLLSGELELHFIDPPGSQRLSPGHPGIVEPEQTHWVEPHGLMRMRIDFHDAPPAI